MITIKDFSFNAFQERCCLVWDETGECVIIDPGFYDAEEGKEMTDFIDRNGLKPVKVLLTHAHFDHVYGVMDCVRKYGVPVYMAKEDRVILDNEEFFCRMFGLWTPDTAFATVDIRNGDTIRFGNTDFEVISTPGHTPGGVCFLDRKDKILFSGDTLFAGSIGRTDNQWGDYDALMEGIMDRLMALDGDIRVIPGHGPQTTIADERTKNPFLQPFNEPMDEE